MTDRRERDNDLPLHKQDETDLNVPQQRTDDVLAQNVTEIDQPDPAHTTAQPAVSAPLFDQDAGDVRRRWREVQASFVDDPRDSVEQAESLLDEITDSLQSALETRSAELQGRWKNTGENDTEQLRTALRDYRAMLEQLLSISAGTR